jgi:hypothetical protein
MHDRRGILFSDFGGEVRSAYPAIGLRASVPPGGLPGDDVVMGKCVLSAAQNRACADSQVLISGRGHTPRQCICAVVACTPARVIGYLRRYFFAPQTGA